MKHLLLLALLLVASAGLGQTLRAPEGKLIYVPRDLQANDFSDPEAQWSYARMAYTDNVVVFWEKGFGLDPLRAPDLDGHPMRVDIKNLLERLETFYTFYRDTLHFVLPGSKSERYRMMVMLNYSLEGTAYGGDYDGEIGALWIAPNRVQDKKLNCIAHELGHSFQSQVSCDKVGHGIVGGIYEMCSQWMLWQVNPQWTTDENYHWQAFRKAFHLPFMAGENIYRSPYVLEYWSMLHGRDVMGRLFREAQWGEDVAAAYMRIYGIDIHEMNRQMTDCYSRLLSFDFPRVRESHRAMAGELLTEGCDTIGRWGFNVVEVPEAQWRGRRHHIDFRPLTHPLAEGLAPRYQLVALTPDGRPTYYGQTTAEGQTVRVGKENDRLRLIVVGCPRR